MCIVFVLYFCCICIVFVLDLYVYLYCIVLYCTVLYLVRNVFMSACMYVRSYLCTHVSIYVCLHVCTSWNIMEALPPAP